MKRTVSKAGRLLLLYLLRDRGLLGDEVSQSDLARWLQVNRSTIHKDLKTIDEVVALYHDLETIQPWVKRFYSTTEVADLLGLSHEAVLRLIQDGAVKATHDGPSLPYRIHVGEVNRWKRFLDGVAPLGEEAVKGS
jgi:excisionase family DNA binding protein